ncbi:hypothetical protein DLAC_09832 [Tieghemostelium lacteum]|uniref:Transmembrane protein n=1 Tax=Tieghemostelium lacteum TaxID=361077 RepID=A0A151Z7B6_TIELA|nr:hypothetical protein DLAC_09832 [Tieghemostelium lacteum]|eukprot:KYQ89856.1 hypothetical protein DLAC_09832 [Tieghemostelium lacteum]
MYSKRFILVIILLQFVYTHQQKLSCPPLDIVKSAELCQYTSFVGNKIEIVNYRDYAYIEISPYLPYIMASGYLYTIQPLAFNASYIVTGVCKTVNSSVNVTDTIKFTEGFSFDIQHAPCRNSMGSIQIHSSLPSIKIQLESDSQPTVLSSVNGVFPPFPMGLRYTSPIYMFTGDDYTRGCNTNIGIIELSTKKPIYKITPHKCVKINGTGSIVIKDYQSYSSITLNGTSTPLNGIFSGLKSGVVNLEFQSEQCGKQTFTETVPVFNPILDLEIDDKCPSSMTLTPSIRESDYNSSEIQFALITNRFDDVDTLYPWVVVNSSSLDFEYRVTVTVHDDTCVTSRNVRIGSTILPIRHQVQSNTITCDGSSSVVVKLYFGISSLRNEITITDLTANNKTLTLDGLDTFSVPYDHNISITATTGCYTTAPPYKIIFPLPIPVVQYNGDRLGLCIEKTSISIANYLDFTRLYLQKFTGDQIPINNQTNQTNIIHHVNGRFENLQRDVYNLYYEYNNCSSFTTYNPTPLYVSLVNRLEYFISPKIYTKFTNITTPVCTIGRAESDINIYHTEVGYIGTLYSIPSYQRHGEYEVSNCTIYLDWNSPTNITIVQPTFNLSTEINQCSGYGNLTIASEPVNMNGIFNILIDGVIVFTTPKAGFDGYVPLTISNIAVGVHQLEIVFAYYFEKCNSYKKTFEIKVPDNLETIEYTVGEMTDCYSQVNLTVPVSKYQNISLTDAITGERKNNITNGNYSVGAGDYILRVYSIATTCPASVLIRISNPSAVDTVTPQYVNVRDPTCYPDYGNDFQTVKHGSDGIVKFSFNNDSYTVDSVWSLNSYTKVNGAIVRDVEPGWNVYYVNYWNCQWKTEFNASYQNPEIGVNVIRAITCSSQDKYNIIQMYTNKTETVRFTSIFAANQQSFIPHGNYLYLPDRTIAVVWNDVCFSYFTINIQYENTNYEPIVKDQSCDNMYNGYLQNPVPDKIYMSLYSDNIEDDQGRIYNAISLGDDAFYEWTNIETGCYGGGRLTLPQFSRMDDLLEFSLISQTEPMKLKVNESCSGSMDGSLQLQTSFSKTWNILTQNSDRWNLSHVDAPRDIIPNFVDYHVPSSSADTFTNMIGNFYYELWQLSFTHPTCNIKYPAYYVIYPQEPLFSMSPELVCIDDSPTFESNFQSERLGNVSVTLSSDSQTLELRSNTCKRNIPLPPLPTPDCTNDDGSNKNKLGLILGLLFGFLALLVGGIITLIIYKKKKDVLKLEPTPINSVPIFTGGHINQLDGF